MNRRIGALVLAALALVTALPASAKDVYKCCLDPAIPHHKAILDTLEKLKAEPNDAALHNDLGCLVARDGFWRDALRELREAARLAPKDGRPLFNAGLVRLYMGDDRGAARAFAGCVKRDPGNWTGWWMLGYARELTGDEEGAVAAYKTSLRVDTTLFDPRVNPYAARTRLKGLALLETYERRLRLATMPVAQQLADPERLKPFLQPMRPQPAAAAAASTTVAPRTEADAGENVTRSGPVITQSPAAGSASAAPSTSAPGLPPTTFKPIPPRRGSETRETPAQREGERRLPQETPQERPGMTSPRPVQTPPSLGPGGGE